MTLPRCWAHGALRGGALGGAGLGGPAARQFFELSNESLQLRLAHDVTIADQLSAQSSLLDELAQPLRAPSALNQIRSSTQRQQAVFLHAKSLRTAPTQSLAQNPLSCAYGFAIILEKSNRLGRV
jgi:hypothetical protein